MNIQKRWTEAHEAREAAKKEWEAAAQKDKEAWEALEEWDSAWDEDRNARHELETARDKALDAVREAQTAQKEAAWALAAQKEWESAGEAMWGATWGGGAVEGVEGDHAEAKPDNFD